MNNDLLMLLQSTCNNLSLSELNDLKKEINLIVDSKVIIIRNTKVKASCSNTDFEILTRYLNDEPILDISLKLGIAKNNLRTIIRNYKIDYADYLLSEKKIKIQLKQLDQHVISFKQKLEFLEYLQLRLDTKKACNPLARMPKGLDTLIKDAMLSNRTTNCLSSYGFKTMREVSNTNEITLRKINNLGKKALTEIQLFLYSNRDLKEHNLNKRSK